MDTGDKYDAITIAHEGDQAQRRNVAILRTAPR